MTTRNSKAKDRAPSRSLPRGIAPDLLVSQVKNTMPYLFSDGPLAEGTAPGLTEFPPAQLLRSTEAHLQSGTPLQLSHFEYFQLCVSAHYLTCATPVPTDVDNQIRVKLWPAELELAIALEMAEWVLASRAWDFTAVSSRNAEARHTDWVTGAGYGLPRPSYLHGHFGEWFTIAAGAYAAMKRFEAVTKDSSASTMAKRLFEAVALEVQHHADFFSHLWKEKDGLGCLKASASIAHNLGDLDRVMDLWELPASDEFRVQFYKLGVKPFDERRNLRYRGALWVAGELYKSPISNSAMAFENHRHFALRKPKCLRRSRQFLVPNGPFFDDWGKTVAQALASQPEELREVVEALIHGWQRLPQSIGYGRALRSFKELGCELDLAPVLKLPLAKQALQTTQAQFEHTWSEAALAWMEEIPSRAT